MSPSVPHTFGSAATLAVLLMIAACDGENPTPASCGDGALDASESCDEGSANGTPGHCKADCSGVPAQVSVEGDVLAFLTEVPGPRIDGATVSVVERPEISVVTGPDGLLYVALNNPGRIARLVPVQAP